MEERCLIFGYVTVGPGGEPRGQSPLCPVIFGYGRTWRGTPWTIPTLPWWRPSASPGSPLNTSLGWQVSTATTHPHLTWVFKGTVQLDFLTPFFSLFESAWATDQWVYNIFDFG